MTPSPALVAADAPLSHREASSGVPGAVYDVHLWMARLDASPVVMRECLAMLAPDETLRFGALPEEPEGREFAVARGVLRVLLARYDGRCADELRFRPGPQGKPALVASRHGLRFSAARSHGLAMVAITLFHEIGVDVEWVRPVDAPATEEPATFFRLATRHEACGKADADAPASSEPHHIHDVVPAPGYVGALAYRGERRRLVTHALAEAGEILHAFPP